MSDCQDTITVGFPIYPDTTLLDFAGATQVFTPITGAGFEPIWMAKDLNPVKTSETVLVQPTIALADVESVDVLFVPGGGVGVRDAMLDRELLREIRRLAKTARYVGSVCTGAFILAAAGLLDGHKATTYWSQLANLNLFPKVEVDTSSYPRALIDESARRFTGGGVSSSIDLAFNLVRILRGEDVCRAIQLSIQYAPGPPFHSGDPKDAWPETTYEQSKKQTGFTAQILAGTEEAIRRMKGG